MEDAPRFAWGTVLCSRCDRGGTVVVEEVDNVARLAGLECKHCGARRCRFIYRGGVCATEDRAREAADAFIVKALTE